MLYYIFFNLGFNFPNYGVYLSGNNNDGNTLKNGNAESSIGVANSSVGIPPFYLKGISHSKVPNFRPIAQKRQISAISQNRYAR